MPDNSAPQPPIAPRRRRLLLGAAFTAFAAMGVLYGLHWFKEGRHVVATDNAYVAGNIVQVSPQVAGTIVEIRADDTDIVTAGQPLVVIDDTDSRLALARARAELARTVREAATLYANDGALAATLSLRQTTLARLEEDFARRSRVAQTGAVSAEEVKHARDAVEEGRAMVAAARKQWEANRVLIEGTAPATHPRVLEAAAAFRTAYVAWRRAIVPAPLSGQVAKRQAQLGQRTQPGIPVMAVVPLDQLWVDANFKEGQLADVRLGQKAVLVADFYGDEIRYHGTVAGLAAGTGSAFSLLPAQNATGNWIKVVQRVPVRIALDPAELAAHPLRVGLSMQVEIDAKDKSGPMLAPAPRAMPLATTGVFAGQDAEAEAAIRQILAENGEAPAALVPGRAGN